LKWICCFIVNRRVGRQDGDATRAMEHVHRSSQEEIRQVLTLRRPVRWWFNDAQPAYQSRHLSIDDHDR
jgi:hypothetical protein